MVEAKLMKLHSILVTTAGRPQIGEEHVLRHAERFWVGRVVSATPGPESTMPSWVVTWEVDQDVSEEQALDMAWNRNTFALDARATPDEALVWHAIDEVHWRQHGYAPNHWT
jgi:hypothetical protein